MQDHQGQVILFTGFGDWNLCLLNNLKVGDTANNAIRC